jgi:type IV pilus assembly protein PilQ
VGDIAVSQADASASAIDLGTGERISRLVLREASAREVLSLLARAANLNIAYVDAPSSTSGGQQQQASPQAGAASTSLDAGPKVSLDIENESVQDVFNYVIRITGLEANRVGRTIFVGPRLPDDARNVISRSLRMNQVTATVAANFLVAQGAEFQLPINRVTFVPITGGTNPVLSRVEEPDIKVIRAERGEAPLPLSGLAVSSNDRVNIVTLTGTPRKVEFATALLSQLDARKRQVAINVRVVDINLLATQRFGSSFSFGIGNTRVVNTGGTGVINFGSSAPSSTGISDPTVVGSTPIGVGNGSIFNFTKAFLLQLQGLITSGDAKILTDPTLVVQEGQQASVKLIQEVVTNFKVETQAGTPPTVTVTIEKAEAGLQLDIALDRIDDNGFITLQVNPKISSPFDTANVNIPSGGAVATQQVTLLQRREVSSGQVRVRDNQTLILTGIIQDSERSTVNKVPILGDIPLLGALFRRSQNQHQRQEVIVVLTPQIIDDSDRANFGYNYTPGPEVQRILNQRDPGAPKR